MSAPSELSDTLTHYTLVPLEFYGHRDHVRKVVVRVCVYIPFTTWAIAAHWSGRRSGVADSCSG